jgi:hypothetical protein
MGSRVEPTAIARGYSLKVNKIHPGTFQPATLEGSFVFEQIVANPALEGLGNGQMQALGNFDSANLFDSWSMCLRRRGQSWAR